MDRPAWLKKVQKGSNQAFYIRGTYMKNGEEVVKWDFVQGWFNTPGCVVQSVRTLQYYCSDVWSGKRKLDQQVVCGQKVNDVPSMVGKGKPRPAYDPDKRNEMMFDMSQRKLA